MFSKEDIVSNITIDSITWCWNFKKWINKWYWRFQKRIHWKKAAFLAHRVSYSVFIWNISEWLMVCHHCDNPSCVNPEHLFLGTAKDNAEDKVSKWRQSFSKAFWNKSSSIKISIDWMIFSSYKSAWEYYWISDNWVRKRFKWKIIIV